MKGLEGVPLRRAAKPKERPEAQGFFLKEHANHAPAWLFGQPRIDREATDCRALERALQLDVADHLTCLKNQVIASIVYLWFEYFKSFDTGQPNVADDLAGE